jgi:hypothetical protein
MTLVPMYSATLHSADSGLQAEVLSLPSDSLAFPFSTSFQSWPEQFRIAVEAPEKGLEGLFELLQFHTLSLMESTDETAHLIAAMSSGRFDLDDWERAETPPALVIDPTLLEWGQELTSAPLLPVAASPLEGRSIADLIGGGGMVILGVIGQDPVLVILGIFGIIFVKPLLGAAQGVAEGLYESLREIVYDWLIEVRRRRKKGN